MLNFIPHPEQIKAMIRIKHGSVKNFVQKYGLGRNAVNDVLKGRRALPTAEAIARDLGYSVHELWPGKYHSDKSGCKQKKVSRHPVKVS